MSTSSKALLATPRHYGPPEDVTHSRMLLRGRELSAAPAIIPIAIRMGLGQALGFAIGKVDELLKAPTTLIQQLPDNAFFVSNLDGSWLSYSGQVLAAYYHPTCVHRASTKGKLDLKRSVAAKGKWAVSFQTRGLFGIKQLLNLLWQDTG